MRRHEHRYALFQDANGNANYYCNGVGTPGTELPICDIYYNRNIGHDRQLAEFGEASYSITDRFKITGGERFADMKFGLTHYANGLKNSGLGTFRGAYHENSFTPKLVGRSRSTG